MIKKIIVPLFMVIYLFSFSQTDTSLQNYTDINGMKQGYWIKKDVDGNKVYEGYFNNDIPVGTFKRFHTNGVVKAEMLFDKKDQKRSSVKMFDNTGELGATGGYYNKLKDGEWKYFGTKETLLMKEEYKNGKKHGMAIKYYPNGAVVEELEWKNGMMDGKWNRYFEDGKIRIKSQHINDKRVGEFIVYYRNGAVEIKGEYKNDLKSGTWIFYTEKGVEEKRITFIDGFAENQEELDREFAKELDELEQNKGKIPDPENFIDNPMEYFQKGRR